jgi:hypothetical protein
MALVRVMCLVLSGCISYVPMDSVGAALRDRVESGMSYRSDDAVLFLFLLSLNSSVTSIILIRPVYP